MRRAIAAAWLACALAAALRAHADDEAPSPPPEPPPEAPVGEDYAIEPADSLEAGVVEVGVGATGRPGSGPRRRRRVRFEDGAVTGSVREGDADPLSGGAIEAGSARARAGAGRLSPRWGRGLLLGAPADPWSRGASDRGAGALFRGRAGEGAWFRAGEQRGIEGFAGRFARHPLAALRGYAGPLALGGLAHRSGGRQGSVALERSAEAVELAMDGSGRWRGEMLLVREHGPTAIAARVRGGSRAFRSLAEPVRSGPARALALETTTALAHGRLRTLAALWRFGPGEPGARAAADVDHRLPGGSALAVGFEEQHGLRREHAVRGGSHRQGLWSEWRGGPPGLALALRHEVFGREAFARDAVRVATTVRAETGLPGRGAVRVTHTAFRVRAGEVLYLPEPASDRLVLRALRGTGERTRIEVRLPAASGQVYAAVDLAAALGSPSRAQWTLEWIRRSRTRGTGRGPP